MSDERSPAQRFADATCEEALEQTILLSDQVAAMLGHAAYLIETADSALWAKLDQMEEKSTENPDIEWGEYDAECLPYLERDTVARLFLFVETVERYLKDGLENSKRILDSLGSAYHGSAGVHDHVRDLVEAA